MHKKGTITLDQVQIKDLFWTPYQALITDVVIPYQGEILEDRVPNVEPSHAIANFRIAAGLETGTFYGMVFQDSDVAKWLEGVAYSLVIKPDEKLEQQADQMIEIIKQAQQEDGYLNTYFTIKEPEHRWENLLECHELYCAGHMMEAAVAYYEATGKDVLLQVVEKLAKHIDLCFKTIKQRGIPGHQEIEIGLMRLYHVTKKSKYLELAQYFINERGQNPNYFAEEKIKRDNRIHFGMLPEDTLYNQSHMPVREQKEAVGHSVRGVYMYTAMADLGWVTEDELLLRACRDLWNNITQKKMYITGGIGSNAAGEAFTVDYDLPNDSCYTETCAAIGLLFFAKQMLDAHPSRKYSEIMERTLYNSIISGMQLDGKRFFYVNPLEVNPGISGELFGYKHVLPQRPQWYACACCPPNVVRLLTSLGKYGWNETADTIYSHLFIGQQVQLQKADIEVESEYPWQGKILYSVHSKQEKAFSIAICLPEYAKNITVTVNGEPVDVASQSKQGYLYLTGKWNKDQIAIDFLMTPRRVYGHPKVRSEAGCVAFMRGPFVYCFEGIDNGADIQTLRVCSDPKMEEFVCAKGPLKGMVCLRIQGFRLSSKDSLYSEKKPQAEPVELIAVPYFAWGNRGKTQMKVWMTEL